MTNVCLSRPVLVEIPAPQPKITGRVRRSYFDILSAGVTPASSTSRPGSQRSSSTQSPQMQAVVQRDLVWQEASGGEEVAASPAHLSKQQLLQLLSSLILMEQRKECRPVRSNLKTLLEDLQQKKTNVYRSIPYSRLGSNRDAHCYRKAHAHLLAFKRACQEGGQRLLQDGRWESALEYALVAWRLASELPQWDTGSHNAIRLQCYHALAAHCGAALQHHRPGPAKARELLRRLKSAPAHSRVTAACAEDLEQLLKEPKN